MPRLRLLADLATANGSAIDGATWNGEPIFDARQGDVVPVVLDATGWAGGDSVTGSTWDSSDGVALSARALNGNVASCAAYVPEQGWWGRQAYRVRNTMTLANGAVRRTTIWLRAVGPG